jgi:hypothetical protein
MVPGLANLMRQHLVQVQSELEALGALRSMSFRKVNPTGADIYDLVFEKASAEAGIGIEPDGRIGSAWFERK